RKKCSLSIKIAGLSADFFWKKSQNLEQVLIECKKEIKKNSTEISEAERNNNTIRTEPSRLTRIQLKKIHQRQTQNHILNTIFWRTRIYTRVS
ncbi:hypothetical protein DRJ25_01905, partial [Candidatus Woesearchaeota archaeon]